ncbi:sugar epimerase [Elizabethkingia miricola]|uniref:WxcM-like protein n=1 Tax=Elizabethkingia miricola TaxID=172045 RepID=A0ABY3NDV6_ELIMR|nr:MULTISPECIES: WxcM-like domain-containing protein [Elizabethkingia]OBS13142.1 sugar epimerase [Elizabethkingia miricola]TYO89757.1 WxcM-like protein [Elizabethkingia miricola]
MIYKGSKHIDDRGIITFNNEFDASPVKRIYTIENNSIDFIRGWQGHAIEQRWFSCMKGSFDIAVIKIDNFENPSKELNPVYFKLNTKSLDYLHIDGGYITAIKALEPESKLLVLADYALGEINDEYRFPLETFKVEL